MLRKHGAGNGKDLPDSENLTPLAHAAIGGHAETVRLLLAAGVVADRFNDRRTALMEASVAGHADVVCALLDGGASIDKVDRYGLTSLFFAVRNKRAEVLDVLIARDAKVGLGATTPLQMAGFDGPVEFVQKLVAAGAVVDQVDEDGNTALHYCVIKSHSAADMLIASTLDVCGSTPLSMASGAEVARALLKAGANVEHADSKGCTPLRRAVRTSYVDVIETLLEAGASVNFADGRTALHVAMEGPKRADVARILLKFDPSLLCKCDPAGCTPLMIATFFNDTDTLRVLLEAPYPDADQLSKAFWTAEGTDARTSNCSSPPEPRWKPGSSE